MIKVRYDTVPMKTPGATQAHCRSGLRSTTNPRRRARSTFLARRLDTVGAPSPATVGSSATVGSDSCTFSCYSRGLNVLKPLRRRRKRRQPIASLQYSCHLREFACKIRGFASFSSILTHWTSVFRRSDFARAMLSKRDMSDKNKCKNKIK